MSKILGESTPLIHAIAESILRSISTEYMNEVYKLEKKAGTREELPKIPPTGAT